MALSRSLPNYQSMDGIITFKLMLVGSTNVGKTCIARRLEDPDSGDACTHDVDKDLEYTVSCSLSDGRKVQLTVFDTKGKKSFNPDCLWRCGEHRIDAFVLVFALNSSRSCGKLTDWIQRVHKVSAGYASEFYLMGNKQDLAYSCQARELADTDREVQMLTRKYTIANFFKVSAALRGREISDAFRFIAQDLFDSNVHHCLERSLSNSSSSQQFAPVHEATAPALSRNQSTLAAALQANQVERLRELLSNASPQTSVRQQIWNIGDPQGRSLLTVAIKRRCPEAARALMECVDPADEAGRQDLLNMPDTAGVRPLMFAAACGDIDAVSWLSSLGAGADTSDRLQFTALTYAACNGQWQAAAQLLKLKATAHWIDFSNNTPLIWAARAGHAQVIRELRSSLTLDQWRHAGEYGKNALQWAEFFNHQECQSLIRECMSSLEADTTSPEQPTATVDSTLLPHEPAVESRGKFYSMQSSQRGFAAMINITDFPPDSDLTKRDGAEFDSQSTGLSRAFVKMGLTPKHFKNSDSQFFEGLLQKICPPTSAYSYADHDAFALFISSHGELGSIYASDGRLVNLEKVFDQVRNEPGLHGKPKIFVVQACRPFPRQPPSCTRPDSLRHADCLYIYSVVEGGSALRSAATGCPFTNALRDIVVKQCEFPIEEFTQLMPDVVDQVARETQDQQIVTYTSTLRMRLFFPPMARCSATVNDDDD